MLTYSVLRDGVERIASAPISLDVEGLPKCGGVVKVKASDTRLVSGKLSTPIYKKSAIDLAGMEKIVEFEGGWSIVLHARNDGVAYRFQTAFGTSGKLKVKVLDETASLVFPTNGLISYAGIADNHQSSWESLYVKSGEIDRLRASVTGDKIVYLPLLVQYPDGVNMVVTESDLLDYPGWNLKSGEGHSLVSSFARLPVEEKAENNQRQRKVTERHGYLCETSGTRSYPWRVFVLASSRRAHWAATSRG